MTFSMMSGSGGGSGGGGGGGPRDKKPTPAVKITTGLGHRAVKPEHPREDPTPSRVPTVDAIDWGKQPPIPAEKIDWQGSEPLRVRPTIGTFVAIIVAAVSVIGAGAFFYWGVRMHVSDQRIHLKANGTLPDLLSERYETRNEARSARAQLASQVGRVGNRVDKLDVQLKMVAGDQQKILQEIRKTRKAVAP